MRQIYAECIGVLKSAADQHLNGVLDVVHAGAGIRTLGWLKSWKSDQDAAHQVQKLGLEVEPFSMFTMKYDLRRGVSISQPFKVRASYS